MERRIQGFVLISNLDSHMSMRVRVCIPAIPATSVPTHVSIRCHLAPQRKIAIDSDLVCAHSHNLCWCIRHMQLHYCCVSQSLKLRLGSRVQSPDSTSSSSTPSFGKRRSRPDRHSRPQQHSLSRRSQQVSTSQPASVTRRDETRRHATPRDAGASSVSAARTVPQATVGSIGSPRGGPARNLRISRPVGPRLG